MNSFCGRRRDFWLVFVARARGTHEGKRKPTLLFSPPVCVRVRPRNLALRLKKIRLRSPGGGGGVYFGFQVCFREPVHRLVKLLKNNSFFSKFLKRWPLVEVRLYICLICSVNILSMCFHSFVV